MRRPAHRQVELTASAFELSRSARFVLVLTDCEGGGSVIRDLREGACRDGHELESVGLATLSGGIAVRAGGIDEAHVDRLLARREEWPPIVVWGPGNVVVDGQHRVVAARRLGSAWILAERFVGSEDDAYVEAVRRNVVHGLPLTAHDRAAAVGRLLSVHPDWSDRRIAGTCGVAARTVAHLRAASRVDGGDDDVPRRRTGRDGRRRPDDATALRREISTILEGTPTLSLRSVAGLVGASPETVRRVRREMAGDGAGIETASGECAPVPEARPLHPAGGRWIGDRALTATDLGQRFTEWFARHEVDDEWIDLVAAVPISRIYEVADEARRRAAVWCDIARALEDRVPRPAGVRGLG